MPTTSWAYRGAIRLGLALAPMLGLFDRRLRAGLQARREAGDRLLDWVRWHRDPARPLVWFHSASVGEGRQAESVMHALRRIQPDCQVLYTHFSPSAEALAARIGADVSDYLPYDLPGPVERLLQALQPTVLVFAKLDIWPELATRAATSGVEVALIAGTVSSGSGRLRWPARGLLEPGYRAIAAAAAVAATDAARLERLGVQPDRIHVLGDPRFDSVVERVRAVASNDPLLRLGQGAPTLVAGSTWPADEAVLLGAFARVQRQAPKARLIIVPHEPTPDHLSRLEQRIRAARLPQPVRLSAAGQSSALLLVDRVGVLASLYGAGSMAYVGGGFGRAGLHSVLEPAAWSLPVAFGPRWQNSRDAELLIQAGAALALPPGPGRAAEVLSQQWSNWIGTPEARESWGRRARQVVEEGVGASERSAALLAQLISARRPRRSPREARSGPQ
jgi:3-deoxy-D-manno-octulosonic-acid transferase